MAEFEQGNEQDMFGKDRSDTEADITTARERLSVRISDKALVITKHGDEAEGLCRLQLTPGEALMLLDILQNESGRLEEMAADASPIPIRFDFRE
jgi:hypothetical protein